MARPFLSLVIPASEEAERLPLALIEADRVFSEAEFAYEIFIVDDLSADATSAIAKRFAETLKNVKVIDNPERRGLGSAMIIGMLAARGNWRVLIPESYGVPFVELRDTISRMQAGTSVDVLLLTQAPPFFSHLQRRLADTILRALFRSQISDFSPAAICFSPEAASRIFQALKTKRDTAVLESLLLAERMGYRISRSVVQGVASLSGRPRHYLQTLYETSKIRWWLWRKKYTV